MAYQISYVASAAKALRKLDRQTARRILEAINSLADDPHPPGCICSRAVTGELRIRIGDYRVVYDIVDDELVILILRVGHRREIYR